MQLLFFSLTPICILLHLVASYQDDFVYSGSVGYLLSNAWREAQDAGIAVAKAAANMDLNLESREGEKYKRQSNK